MVPSDRQHIHYFTRSVSVRPIPEQSVFAKKRIRMLLTSTKILDVVSGVRTPHPISELDDEMPEAYKEFVENIHILEKHLCDMQDIEFTIERGKLFMLQTRNGKCGGEAAVKIAVDLVSEDFTSKNEAIKKVLPEHLDQLLHPRFPNVEQKEHKDAVITDGLAALSGAAVGHIAMSNKKVVENKKNGIPSIMVRDETSPHDVLSGRNSNQKADKKNVTFTKILRSNIAHKRFG
jgi:phosphoenolpyruvate synthase/pyruvate phosphate dikinase